jgi:methylmalonyl-CoA/ethylmalonyl-CoA epimerase
MTRKAIFDHVAIAALELTDGWKLFGGVLGGSWVYGDDSPGFWWGQLGFQTGPKIEMLTPTGGPDAVFLERFLSTRRAGPHHLNFIVPEINEMLARVRAVGIEPVQVSLDNPAWKEAFLHPKDAHGIVVQVAEQSGQPSQIDAPAELPAPGPPTTFALVEHYVADLDSAVRLFAEVLDGELVGRPDTGRASPAELTWDNGARLRLVPTGPEGRAGLGTLMFARDGGGFSPAERSEAADLARRLAVSVQLGL